MRDPHVARDPSDPAIGRPDWVVCVRRPHINAKTYWCDRIVTGEFAFTGVDHALANDQNHGRLVPCGRCREAIARALQDAMVWPPEIHR